MNASDIAQFHSQGFLVLRAAIDPMPITAELNVVGRDAFDGGDEYRTLGQGTGSVTFRYVPMMCDRTPASLTLVDTFAVVARDLLGRSVIPGRAKGTWYDGDTGWHRDSAHSIASVGIVTYLEPLEGGAGALQVIPGSHLDHDRPLPQRTDDEGEAIETEPGDVIVFDEHLIHGSTGGTRRRQWRVDFVVDPHDEHELAAGSAWFDQSIPDERNEPAYNAARYPSYGRYWQTRDRYWTDRLRELGVYRRVNGQSR